MAHAHLRLAVLVVVGALGGCVSSNSNPSPGPFDAGSGFDATLEDSASPSNDASGASDGGADIDSGPVSWPDAGASCSPPSGPSGLSATAAGLPASGLVLWLRGDRGVYTTQADAGAADAGGPSVCAWADQSGGGWLFTGQTTTLPTLLATGVGGQAALAITAGATLQTSGVLGIPATSPRTFIAVESLVSAGGRFDPIIQGQLGTAGTYIAIDANTWETTGNLEGVYMTSNSIDSNTATSAGTARVHVFTVLSMTAGDPFSTALDYRVNGVTQTLTVKQGNGQVQDFSGADFTAVEAPLSSSTGLPTSGRVAEVLVYDRALSVSERATVEGVMKTRYAIQ